MYNPSYMNKQLEKLQSENIALQAKAKQSKQGKQGGKQQGKKQQLATDSHSRYLRIRFEFLM